MASDDREQLDPGGRNDGGSADARRSGRVFWTVGLSIVAAIPFLLGVSVVQDPLMALAGLGLTLGLASWVTLIAVIVSVARVMASHGVLSGSIPGALRALAIIALATLSPLAGIAAGGGLDAAQVSSEDLLQVIFIVGSGASLGAVIGYATGSVIGASLHQTRLRRARST